MSRWYRKVTADSNNFYAPLGEAIEYFYNEYEEARLELTPPQGGLITEMASSLPGIVEHRMAQYHELEGILKFLEIHYDKAKGIKKKHFLEHYNRDLSERSATERADIEPEVILIREFIQEVALIRNLFTGITKGLEYLHFQIGNITKLKSAGFEDATF
jgi:hypothetical protein